MLISDKSSILRGLRLPFCQSLDPSTRKIQGLERA